MRGCRRLPALPKVLHPRNVVPAGRMPTRATSASPLPLPPLGGRPVTVHLPLHGQHQRPKEHRGAKCSPRRMVDRTVAERWVRPGTNSVDPRSGNRVRMPGALPDVDLDLLDFPLRAGEAQQSIVRVATVVHAPTSVGMGKPAFYPRGAINVRPIYIRGFATIAAYGDR